SSLPLSSIISYLFIPISFPSNSSSLRQCPSYLFTNNHMVFTSNELDYPYFPFRIKIDYVLVSRTDDLSRQYHRSAFERALKSEGLIIAYEVVYPFLFTLISCPFWRLCKEAEKESLYFPLKKILTEPSLPSCIISLPHSAFFIAPDSVNFVNVPFDISHSHLFIDFEDERKFFSSCQRNFLTYQILCDVDINSFIERNEGRRESSLYHNDPDRMKRKGLIFMLMEKTYQDGFVLHDLSEGDTQYRKIKENVIVNVNQFFNDIDDPRLSLSRIWSNWLKTQPLNMIRNYFGEAIGFYFAWEGTFCTLLWPAAIVGIAVFIYGLTKSIHDSPRLFHECFILNSTGISYIVPCSTTNHLTQLFSAVSKWTLNAFDTELTAFFAVFMSIWGSIFLTVWNRNSSVLTSEWDCESIRETECDRAQFIGTSTEIDPVTGETVIVYPSWIRWLKIVASLIIVLFSMGIVVCSVISVILYKCFALQYLHCNKEFNWLCSLCINFLPSILNTSSTMVLGMIYSGVVYRLTDWENHQTQTEYQNALIVKLFAFQFVNNYTSLFYIAFVRPESNGFQTNGLFGLGPIYKDVCKEGTCGSLLALQLIIHLIIKPFPKWSKDIVIPYFVRLTKLARFRWRKKEETAEEMAIGEQEKNILIREWVKPNPGDFVLSELSEKTILFGTTMMFAALFPLAPLIALIIGVIDIRIDASRLVWFNRRPIPERVAGIGIWLNILTFIQYAAVLTNAFIVSFTSDFCTSFFSGSIECNVENRLVIVLVFQNATFLLKYLLQSVIPSTSTELRISQRRKRFVAHYVDEKGHAPEGGLKSSSQLIQLARKAVRRSSPIRRGKVTKTKVIDISNQKTSY
ncbi:anoh-1, partial [Pristionchus pacificus]